MHNHPIWSVHQQGDQEREGIVTNGRDFAAHGSAASYLERQLDKLRAAGLEADGEVRFGVPAEMIVSLADRSRATLIAMATHGYSGVRRWALGSIADKVLHATTTPLVLLRASARDEDTVKTVKDDGTVSYVK